ncbi:hypothetical protein D3C85_1180070 [compost metagenome]
MVNAGLAPDGGIHLRQQGSRDLDEVHATLVTGGREAGHVTNDAPTQGDDRGTAVMPCGQQCIEDQLQGFPVLERLAVRKNHRQYRISTERAAQALQVQGGDSLVGNDGYLTPGNMRRQQLGLIQQAFADMNRIATFAKFDLKCLHVSPQYGRAQGRST